MTPRSLLSPGEPVEIKSARWRAAFYRVLRDARQLKHRRAERPAKPRFKPRALCATAPNQLYSGDITYLPSRIKGQYFYLYGWSSLI
ncbi:hypothetical protein Rin_00010480 [Candidatus Regiella insecticola 5.15]|uniref:Uncharacterized protein n=1 Tax=Candidatus Regiella insecticola 5.15 TaxID=1005043 RepID=G2GZ33_9ENTR|nr:hypothetical protein [Candidatus Regiella insecticola]EGY29007.1 hypothetical protein Rin_00010480 [Candidatus Regiella insecticola 5.15]